MTAAWIAAALLVGVAIFQVALALGAPFGDATMGGRAETVNGVLTPRYRVVAAASAVVLAGFAWVVLLDGLSWPKWVVAALLGVSSLANFAASHPLERWLFAPVAAVTAAACAVTALAG